MVNTHPSDTALAVVTIDEAQRSRWTYYKAVLFFKDFH
jgi:hypothetical protein